MKTRNVITLVMIVIAIVFLFFYPSKNKFTTIKFGGTVQGTFYTITYLSPDDVNYQAEIAQILKDFEHSMSVYDSASTISRINRNDSAVHTDSIFNTIFRKAQEISKITGGAFDITVGPLCQLWGFYNNERIEVTQQMIDEILLYTGYQKVRLENNTILKDDERITLDANAIAKGFSCDLVGNFLEEKGIKNYLVEIGGEIKTKGNNPHKKAWAVGINKAIDDKTGEFSENQQIIRIRNAGLATSGNYRKFYYLNGKKYVHTINPVTGYPVEHNLLSATIIAPDCITADAYATACMVLGLEKSMELIESLSDIEAYFIYQNNNGKNAVSYTKGFEKYLEK